MHSLGTCATELAVAYHCVLFLTVAVCSGGNLSKFSTIIRLRAKCVQLIISMEVVALEAAYTKNRIVLLDKSLLLELDNVRV